MTRKEEKHLGQRPLDGLTEFETKAEDRPRGMPPLSEIRAETARLGLPDSDAEYLYDTWLVSGFKTARGTKIHSWTAAVRLWARAGWFPSQKAPLKPKPGELMTNEILEALAQNPAYKKVDVHKAAWDFRQWCEAMDKPKLVTSFVKFLNAKL
jgi:hypothetical protein